MNQTQLQTGVAPIIAFIAGLLAGKGVFGLDAATWATVIGGAVAFGATIWGVVSTRKTAIANTLGNYPDTTVVTDKATASALPANTSVMSNQTAAVVLK